jgi:hypothetical protein
MDGFGLVANGLGDGNDPDAMLGKSPEIEFLFECFAEETAVAVNHNKIERMLTVAGTFDHLLEGRPAIIASRGAASTNSATTT